MLHRLAALVLIPSFAAATHAQSTSHFDGKSWWEYVKVLAGDNMEGRDTGSPGLKRAEQYVVEQLKKNGLEAAGRKGYYQTINFVSREIDEKNSSLALVRDGVPVPLTLGEEAYISTRAELAPRLEAPLVFVGYGLRVPEKNYDDVAGLALKGKVVVLLMGSPAEIPAPLASHYQSASERWKAFRNAGAVGMVTILNPASMDIPWSRISANRTRPSMDLAYPEFHDNADQKLAVVFNPEKAELLFAGSGHTFAELAELAKDRKPLPRFPLKVSIAAKTKVKTRRLKSANIVAKLPGSDPQLRNQYVVLSAHLDHVGIGAPINGDRIYNGAMDNGSGSALLLDMAASLKSSPEKLRRSVSVRNRRRKRTAGFALLCGASHRGWEIDRRRSQYRHVPAHRAPESSARAGDWANPIWAIGSAASLKPRA